MAIMAIVLALVAVGCGRFRFEEQPAVDDGGSDVAFVADASPDAPLGPFGPPVAISISTAALEDDPSLTADLLELFFESDRGGGSGGSDIWFTTRTSISAPWAVAQPVGVIDSAANEEHVGVSADGLTMFFASDRIGGLGSFDIYFATRADRQAGTPWSTPQPAANLNNAQNNEAPQIDSTGLVMVFASGSNSLENLFISERAATTDTWPTPSPITELNTAMGDTAPMLDTSGLTIYFSSNRAGQNDLYVATRPSTSEPFGSASMISELSSASDGETDPWISPDGRTIVFVSDVNGTRDLFEATR